MGNVLVLGAGGFIGHNLVKALIKQHHVIGYDLHKQLYDFENYTHICGNFTEESDFKDILEKHKIDTIYHLVSTSVPNESTEKVIDEIKCNIISTIRLLDAMVECNVKRIIFTSSGGTVYGEGNKKANQEGEILNPICSYGVQKASIEMYLNLYKHMHDIQPIIARISNPYGVLKEQGRTQGIIPIFLDRLYQGEPITLFGDTIRDYIYIDDVIFALVKMYDYKGKESVINIGSGVSVELKDLVRLLEDITNKKFIEIKKKNIRKCDVAHSVLDITTAKKELNWEPIVSLECGITKIISDKYQ